MTANDGFLYTGVNSVTRDNATVRERAKEQKEAEQHEIEPFAPAIFALINKEKKGMGTLLAGLVDSKQTAQEVQAHIEAVKLHSIWLSNFEAQVKNKLRVGRKQKVKQGESFAEIIEEGKQNARR